MRPRPLCRLRGMSGIRCACRKTVSSATTTRCATRGWSCRSRRTGTAITSSRRRSGSTNTPMANWRSFTARDALAATNPMDRPSSRRRANRKPRDPLRCGPNAAAQIYGRLRLPPIWAAALSTEADNWHVTYTGQFRMFLTSGLWKSIQVCRSGTILLLTRGRSDITYRSPKCGATCGATCGAKHGISEGFS